MKQMLQILSFSFLKTFTEKIFLTLSLIFFTQQLLAQFSDNFEDGSLAADPTWVLDENRFTISGGQLRLQAPAVADVSYLETESAAINEASWEFYVKITFNPSSSNYCRVYLTSDQTDLTSALNGYYVMVGNTSDEISLYKQTGSSRLEIIDGLDGRLNASASEMKIKVTRDALGNWLLQSDVGLTGSFVSEGTVNDSEHFSSAYFGIFCNYTATRSDKFFFDDIVVTGSPYVPPPPATYKDVIISEIFPDPSPRVELPESEYLEIHNRSPNRFNLLGWQLTDGTSTATLSGYTLLPGEYLILTSATSAPDFSVFGNTLPVSSFPSLNNSSDALVLRSPDGLLIDSVHYESTWFKSDSKREGGWSLELIDPSQVCGEETNWAESENDDGGTPGKINSVLANKPDVTGPKLLSAIPLTGTELLLTFDEKLSITTPFVDQFTIAPANTVDNVAFTDQSLRKLVLSLNQSLQPSTLYSITVNQVYDCAGNGLQAAFNTAKFALPEVANSLDVVINEILFNPRPTGVDFVEIVNVSNKYLNLKSWSVAHFENGLIDSKETITNENRLISPGEYLVLTTDKNVLMGEYLNAVADRILEVNSLPSLNDDTGSLVLLDDSGLKLDYLSYTKDLHSVFIKDDEGVSLERISFTQPTNDPQNWKSASAVIGFATPGYLNSQSRPEVLADDAVIVSPEIFVPESGQPDFTEIKYQFDQGGYVANIKIIDSSGREIKELANNELLGTTGFIRWDGDQNDGSRARIGYYMVWFEVINSTGTVKTFRKRLAIAARF